VAAKPPKGSPFAKGELSRLLAVTEGIPCRNEKFAKVLPGRAGVVLQPAKSKAIRRIKLPWLRSEAPTKCAPGEVPRRGWCSAQRIKICMIAGGNHTLIHRLGRAYGAAFSASPRPTSLVTFLFGDKKVTPPSPRAPPSPHSPTTPKKSNQNNY